MSDLDTALQSSAKPEETFKEMSREEGRWEEFDLLASDGLELG